MKPRQSAVSVLVAIVAYGINPQRTIKAGIFLKGFVVFALFVANPATHVIFPVMHHTPLAGATNIIAAP